MARFSVARLFIPAAAFAAQAEAVERWWDAWLTFWSCVFDPMARKEWRDAERAESLDADQIDHTMRGGFAASSGGDEG